MHCSECTPRPFVPTLERCRFRVYNQAPPSCPMLPSRRYITVGLIHLELGLLSETRGDLQVAGAGGFCIQSTQSKLFAWCLSRTKLPTWTLVDGEQQGPPKGKETEMEREGDKEENQRSF